jgi:hypothetical protein
MGRPKIRWAHYDSDPIEDEWEEDVVEDTQPAPDTEQPQAIAEDSPPEQDGTS